MILCNFRSRRPKYLIEQNDTLSWLALAHARAESMKNTESGQPPSKFASSDLIARLLKRYGCSSE
ncbi:MAG: hypothetical protein AB1403_20125, partial [Candidatus Riflebacteria bacterium]